MTTATEKPFVDTLVELLPTMMAAVLAIFSTNSLMGQLCQPQFTDTPGNPHWRLEEEYEWLERCAWARAVFQGLFFSLYEQQMVAETIKKAVEV